MPQSPRWLVMAGRGYEAKAVLETIREDDPALIDAELDEIAESIVEEPGGWKDLLDPVVKAALVVGVGLAILQQVSGINTVIYFAPTIVGYTGVDSSSAAILASVAVGIVNVGMTLVAIRLLDRAGRRPLLLWGSAVMAVALSILALVFILGAGSTAGSLVAIGSLMLYVGAFASASGRSSGSSTPRSTRCGSAARPPPSGRWRTGSSTSSSRSTFLLLIDALGNSGAFFFYAAVCVLTFFFCLRLVPETKGKHLEDIQAIFRERAEGRQPEPSSDGDSIQTWRSRPSRRRPSGLAGPSAGPKTTIRTRSSSTRSKRCSSPAATKSTEPGPTAISPSGRRARLGRRPRCRPRPRCGDPAGPLPRPGSRRCRR